MEEDVITFISKPLLHDLHETKNISNIIGRNVTEKLNLQEYERKNLV